MKSFIINYKAYAEAFDRQREIAEAAAEIAKETGVDIIASPPFSELKETTKIIKTLAQSMDDVEPGAFTGHVSWYEIKNSGAVGTLLNHSEKRYALSKGGPIEYSLLKAAVELCKQNNLETYICVQNVDEAKEVLKLKPTAIAYEPPELIGGDISVSTSKPEIVKEFCDVVRSVPDVKPLIGAGIKTAEDVSKSVELGSEGILVASGVMKAKDPKSAILELAKPLS